MNFVTESKGNNSKKYKCKSYGFLHSACCLMLIDICMKFREDTSVTDRQTDAWGKNNISPNPTGGVGT